MTNEEGTAIESAERAYVFDVRPALERRGMQVDDLHALIGDCFSKAAWGRFTDGRIKNARTSTITLICSTLDCEPGELFVKKRIVGTSDTVVAENSEKNQLRNMIALIRKQK